MSQQIAIPFPETLELLVSHWNDRGDLFQRMFFSAAIDRERINDAEEQQKSRQTVDATVRLGRSNAIFCDREIFFDRFDVQRLQIIMYGHLPILAQQAGRPIPPQRASR